ncbi:MAG: hypothetical protein GC159_09170 [Phycisphaera sp.]|nr:hypothetical protein [Phycisphaera sp.]
MTILLAAVPTSILKPILCFGLLLLWARWATIVDKDAMFYHQKRRMWNAIQVASGGLGFIAVFFVPLFILGFILGLLVMVGAASAYVIIRNKDVPENKKWRFDKEMFQEMLQDIREQKAVERATLKFPKAPSSLKSVPLPEDPTFEQHLAFEKVLQEALRQRAQRVDLVGNDQEFARIVRVDGIDYRQEPLAPQQAVAVIDYIKAQAGLDVTDRRKLQTADVPVDTVELGSHVLRVTTSGSTRGLKCSIMIDPVKQMTIKFDELGFLDAQSQKVKAVIQEAKGVVLIAGMPGEGRTATMYAILEQHDPYTMDIHSIETGVERPVEGIRQHDVDKAEVARSLHSLMLREPQVVMVNQVADELTAHTIAKAGVEGYRIYAGVTAEDTFAALQGWMQAVGDAQQVSAGLAAITAQKLVRKLCKFCRQEYAPDANVIRKLNLPSDRPIRLYKAGGQVIMKGNKPEPCPSCAGTGYDGRTAAYEVMIIDDRGRELIAAADIEQLRGHLRRQKTLWLQEAILGKVVNGVTSINEVLRVMGKENA